MTNEPTDIDEQRAPREVRAEEARRGDVDAMARDGADATAEKHEQNLKHREIVSLPETKNPPRGRAPGTLPPRFWHTVGVISLGGLRAPGRFKGDSIPFAKGI